MAGTLTHAFVSTHVEAGSSIGQVSANEWNASHSLSGTWDSSQITSISAGQITGTITGSQIATIGSSQLSTQVLSSQVASLGSSQLTGSVLSSQIASVLSSQVTLGIAFGSSFITTYPTSQITVGASNLAFTSSYIQTIGSSQLTAGTSQVSLTSSYINTIGSSQVTGVFPSSQIGVGPAASSQLAYFNSSDTITGDPSLTITASAGQMTLASSAPALALASSNTAADTFISRQSSGSLGIGKASTTIDGELKVQFGTINESSIVPVFGSSMPFQVAANGLNQWGIGQITFGNTSFGSGMIFAKTRGSIPSSNAGLGDNDQIGIISYFGADASGVDGSFARSGQFIHSADNSYGMLTGNKVPGQFRWATSSGGTSTVRLRLDSIGILSLVNGSAGTPPYGIINTTVALHSHSAFGGI